jgi:ribonucleoside-diphosphate reductase alpha subunit
MLRVYNDTARYVD